MGCVESVEVGKIPTGRRFKKLMDQEKCMIERERELGFSRLDTRTVFLTFMAYQNESGISKSQLRDIGDQLGIEFLKQAGEESKIEIFAAQGQLLAKFLIAEEVYSAQKLTLLGLLCTPGGPSQKAMHYMRLLDPMVTGKISKAKFAEIYTQAEVISTDFLKDYNIQRCGEADGLLKDRVSQYIADIHKVKDKTKTQAVTEFFGEAQEISRDEFLGKFIEKTTLTSPYTMRIFATEVLKNSPPTETFKNYTNAFANLLGPKQAAEPAKTETAADASAKLEESKENPNQQQELQSKMKHKDAQFFRIANELPAEENWSFQMDELAETEDRNSTVRTKIRSNFGLKVKRNMQRLATNDTMYENHDHRCLISPRYYYEPIWDEYHLHTLIFKRQYSKIEKYLKSCPDLPSVLSQTDIRGNTPLLLAVKLSHLSIIYTKIIWVLLEHGARPDDKDTWGWTVLDEAVEKQNETIVRMLVQYLYFSRMQRWDITKTNAANSLAYIPDFYVEIGWEFTSSYIPFVSAMAPRDTWKLWKLGQMIRLDTTLVGWKKFKSKRRHISLLFVENELILVNHSKKLLVFVMEEMDSYEMEAVVGDIMNMNSIQGDLSIDDYRIKQALSWLGKPITSTVSGYQATKYNIKIGASVDFRKKTRNYLLIPEEKYFDQGYSPASAAPQVGQYLKRTGANVWISPDFPINFTNFMPILDLLSQSNPVINKFRELLTHQKALKALQGQAFPVKFEFPMSYSVRGVICFKNYKPIDEGALDLFSLPSYKLESRRVAQKILTRPKKRAIFTNFLL